MIVEPTPEQKRLAKQDALKTSITGVVMLTAGALTLWSIVIVVSQAVRWLKFGYWEPLSIAEALRRMQWGYPTTDYRGVQKIIDWAVQMPLSLGIFMVAALGAFAWLTYADHETDEFREARRVNAQWRRANKK